MKFKNMLARTKEFETAQTSHTDRILYAVSVKPGLTAGEISETLGLSTSTSSIISQLARKGRIKRTQFDNGYRYYPISAAPIVAEAGDNIIELPPEPVEESPKDKVVLLSIELLKDYVWETGADATPLKAFMEWVKNGRDN